jgi:uncharacterized protein YceK
VLALGILVLVLLTSTGCSSERGNWTYSLTRQCYENKYWEGPWPQLSNSASQWDCTTAIGVVGILMLPVIIDTAILPITATHDLLGAR